MLLFCTYVSLREPKKAAEELQLASSDLFDFDVGAHAAALRSANDANATEAALAAPQSILKTVEAKSTDMRESREGFYATVLCAAVEIFLG